MKLRLSLAVLFMVALPLAHSSFKARSSISAVPYNSIALAGHAMPGSFWCPCNTPEAECHLGDSCFEGIRVEDGATESETTVDTDVESDALLTALIVLLWIQFGA